MSHELGHNLNMKHDFIDFIDFIDGTNAPRFDKSGNSCTGIGGVMDYAVRITIFCPFYCVL